MLVLFLSLTAAILMLFYIVRTSSKNFDHWKKQGVKHLKRLPLVGNMFPIVTNWTSSAEQIRNLYNAFPHERYFFLFSSKVCDLCCRYLGMFQFAKPVLIIRNLALIKGITIKHWTFCGSFWLCCNRCWTFMGQRFICKSRFEGNFVPAVWPF